jgi:coenzyme Q-binding protein COQ10
VLQRLIGLLFNEAVSRMVGAFEARARQLYGERQHAPTTAASPCHPATSRA